MSTVPRAICELGDIPSVALVMGGNWDKRFPEYMQLSPESIMRVRALGALGMHGKVDTGIFCGGLIRQDTPEATEQHRLFESEFPKLHLRLLEEDLGHTTRWDAEYTADLVDREGITGPFTLITSKDYMRRQTRVFERRGFDIIPVAAEPLVASISPSHKDLVESYMKSFRRIKLAASELALLGLDYVDPESKITEFMAAYLRPNHV